MLRGLRNRHNHRQLDATITTKVDVFIFREHVCCGRSGGDGDNDSIPMRLLQIFCWLY